MKVKSENNKQKWSPETTLKNGAKPKSHMSRKQKKRKWQNM